MSDLAQRIGRAMVLLGLIVGTAGRAEAGMVITNRADLNAILGGSGMTEGFERYNISSNADVSIVTILNSSTIVNGQGPGLVLDALSFDMNGGTLQWNAANYLGQ